MNISDFANPLTVSLTTSMAHVLSSFTTPTRPNISYLEYPPHESFEEDTDFATKQSRYGELLKDSLPDDSFNVTSSSSSAHTYINHTNDALTALSDTDLEWAAMATGLTLLGEGYERERHDFGPVGGPVKVRAVSPSRSEFSDGEGFGQRGGAASHSAIVARDHTIARIAACTAKRLTEGYLGCVGRSNRFGHTTRTIGRPSARKLGLLETIVEEPSII